MTDRVLHPADSATSTSGGTEAASALRDSLPQEGSGFRPLNRAYRSVFRPGRLTLGLVVPIEFSPSPVPTMERHIERARLAERLGFASLWLRDVPFNVPSFGDAGPLYDPFVYLGALAAHTSRIGLGVASVILPLRHPAHVAKAAASADVLSGGRLLLGVASGDRPEEYPALAQPFADRGERFREAYDYIRRMAEAHPTVDNTFGRVGHGMDLIPKPASGRLPLLITGSSRQSPEWIATHGDGWMIYPREASAQTRAIRSYREHIRMAEDFDKPVMQPLYLDLNGDPDARPRPLHLGMRAGVHALTAYLDALEHAGVNHVALNLRFNQADIEETLAALADALLPRFPTLDA